MTAITEEARPVSSDAEEGERLHLYGAVRPRWSVAGLVSAACVALLATAVLYGLETAPPVATSPPPRSLRHSERQPPLLATATVAEATQLFEIPGLGNLALQKLNEVFREKVLPRLRREIPIKIRQEGKDPLPYVGNQTGMVRIKNLQGMSSINITSVVATRFYGTIDPYAATMIMTAEYLEDITADGELIPSASTSNGGIQQSGISPQSLFGGADVPVPAPSPPPTPEETGNDAGDIFARRRRGVAGFSFFQRRRRTAAWSGGGDSEGDKDNGDDGADHGFPFKLPVRVPKVPRSLAFNIRIRGMRIPAAAATATVTVTRNQMLAVQVHDTPIEYSDFEVQCEHGLLGAMAVASKALCTKMANRAADKMKSTIQIKLSAQMKKTMQKVFDEKMPMKLPPNKYGMLYNYTSIVLLVSAVTFVCLLMCCVRCCFCRPKSEFQPLPHDGHDQDDHSEGME